MRNLIIQIALVVVSLVLVYLIYDGIQGPIRFNNEVDKRRDEVIENLKDIREAQIAYRSVNGKYTASFDTLISFIMTGEIPIIMLTKDPDDTTFTKQIIDTVGYVSVMDSIFHNRESFDPQQLKYIPFSDNQIFDMQAGSTKKGGVTVNVIEVFAANKYFLQGMNLEKHNIDPEDGLRFGSMSDPKTDGNWE